MWIEGEYCIKGLLPATIGDRRPAIPAKGGARTSYTRRAPEHANSPPWPSAFWPKPRWRCVFTAGSDIVRRQKCLTPCRIKAKYTWQPDSAFPLDPCRRGGSGRVMEKKCRQHTASVTVCCRPLGATCRGRSDEIQGSSGIKSEGSCPAAMYT